MICAIGYNLKCEIVSDDDAFLSGNKNISENRSEYSVAECFLFLNSFLLLSNTAKQKRTFTEESNLLLDNVMGLRYIDTVENDEWTIQAKIYLTQTLSKKGLLHYSSLGC
ncbi:hypothetical protein NPIL_49991 [Nephila pilipes]|uniref:Uncharacterized protein n=1 Tax=Nephila pilipes TaxID=299642 RepID=A0A8X6NKX0_NEPPI|nr:hypothetical protein NPIL_49991 [Nephila pilipes]